MWQQSRVGSAKCSTFPMLHYGKTFRGCLTNGGKKIIFLKEFMEPDDVQSKQIVTLDAVHFVVIPHHVWTVSIGVVALHLVLKHCLPIY